MWNANPGMTQIPHPPPPQSRRLAHGVWRKEEEVRRDLFFLKKTI